MYSAFTFKNILSYKIIRSYFPNDGTTQRLVQAFRKRKILFAASENNIKFNAQTWNFRQTLTNWFVFVVSLIQVTYSEVTPWNVLFRGTWGFYVFLLRLTEMRRLNMLSTADLCSYSLKTGAYCNSDFLPS
jgi:hypothetical protein